MNKALKLLPLFILPFLALTSCGGGQTPSIDDGKLKEWTPDDILTFNSYKIGYTLPYDERLFIADKKVQIVEEKEEIKYYPNYDLKWEAKSKQLHLSYIANPSYNHADYANFCVEKDGYINDILRGDELKKTPEVEGDSSTDETPLTPEEIQENDSKIYYLYKENSNNGGVSSRTYLRIGKHLKSMHVFVYTENIRNFNSWSAAEERINNFFDLNDEEITFKVKELDENGKEVTVVKKEKVHYLKFPSMSDKVSNVSLVENAAKEEGNKRIPASVDLRVESTNPAELELYREKLALAGFIEDEFFETDLRNCYYVVDHPHPTIKPYSLDVRLDKKSGQGAFTLSFIKNYGSTK